MRKNQKNKFTFLTTPQIFSNYGLDILKKYGIKCSMTDFAILLGGYVSSEHYTSEGNELKNRAAWWWTKTFDIRIYDPIVVGRRGDKSWNTSTARTGGIRPAIAFSSILSLTKNQTKSENGILEVEYGEYPQYIVLPEVSKMLEERYINGAIKKTGKSYTTDYIITSVENDVWKNSFHERRHIEYEYNGKKYIRFVGDSNCIGSVLSDGTIVEEGKSYWIEVSSVKWMIDETTNIALSKYLIASGLQFKIQRRKSDVYQGDFENTEIYRFMNNIFAKDIIPSVVTKEAERQSTNAETMDEKKQIAAKLQEYEQLQQELKGVQKEQARLLAKEIELNTRISKIEVEIQGKGQYVRK